MKTRVLGWTCLAAILISWSMCGPAAAGLGAWNGPEFKVIIPPDIDANGLHIVYGRFEQNGMCGAIGSMVERSKREYSIPVYHGERLRVYAYCPGYQVVWVVDQNLDVPWAPQFKRAPTVTLTGKLTDSKGRPLANGMLRFSYFMDEHLEFFNERAGGLTGPSILGEAVTGKDGSFRVEVADMGKDPFVNTFSKWKERDLGTEGLRREIFVDLEPPRDVAAEGFVRGDPCRIPMLSKYDQPITIVMRNRGHLFGRISEEFRKEKGIVGPVSANGSGIGNGQPFWLSAEPVGQGVNASGKDKDGHDHYNCRLRQDWTFDVWLPVGKYNLAVVQGYNDYSEGRYRSSTRRQIVATDVVVADGEDTKTEVK